VMLPLGSFLGVMLHDPRGNITPRNDPRGNNSNSNHRSNLQSSTYHGRLEAASTKTRSDDFARPSICTNSSVFILLLPSCSPLCDVINPVITPVM
jgi:hypothetical protein